MIYRRKKKTVFISKSHPAPVPVIKYPGPVGTRLASWSDLRPGDVVEVQAESGFISRARVDILSPDGTMLWLRADGTGLRTLHLEADTLILYKSMKDS